MNSNCGTNDHAPFGAPDNMPTSVTNCDNQSVSSEPGYQAGNGSEGDPCSPQARQTCSINGGRWDWDNCICYGNTTTCPICVEPVTPIVIDIAGNGFDLTDAIHGVNFGNYALDKPKPPCYHKPTLEIAERQSDGKAERRERSQNRH